VDTILAGLRRYFKVGWPVAYGELASLYYQERL
jgi:hypothetical protein